MPRRRPVELPRTVILSGSAAGYSVVMARSPVATIRFLTTEERARVESRPSFPAVE
jgi:hypothetical protein